jgi:alanyl aminopeptidase
VDAREAFPCWDEPGFKIPYAFTLSVPPGLVAVTNSPVEREEPATDGWRAVTFAETPPLPAYLLAIAVGPFDVVPLAGWSVPARILTPRGEAPLAATAVEMSPPVLPALERWFGQPYPFAKLDLVAVPEFWPGAMENPGLVAFSDSILLTTSEAATPRWRVNYGVVLTHELAHMWFGDLVTMRWWDDLWLNESFADWLADKVAQQVFPELGVDAIGLRGVQFIFSQDAHPNTQAIRRPIERSVEILDSVGLAYAKGRAVLRMVEGWLSEETFRRGVQLYLRRHAWGNAVGGDLWAALGEVSGQDVAAVLSAFVDQPGYPLVDVAIEDAERGLVRLKQSRFANAGVVVEPQLWHVPMVLSWSDGARVHTRPLLLTAAEQEVTLGTPVRWLLPNAGSRGYYRWRLPPVQLAALVAAAPTGLTVSERIGLLGNASALLDAAALAGPELLSLLAAFAADPDAEVALAATDRLELLEQPLLRAAPEPAAAWLRETIAPALARIGELPVAGESAAVSRLRPRLLQWLGDRGADRRLRGEARRRVEDHLAGRTPLEPTLATTWIALAAIEGDGELFARFRQRFESADTPEERQRFLFGMAMFREPRAVDEALAYSSTGPLRADELTTIPFYIRRGGDEPADRVVAWLAASFDTLAPRLTEEEIAFLSWLGSGCSPERLSRVRSTLGAHPAVSAAGTLEQVGDWVGACVALRRREGEAVTRWMLGEVAAAEPAPTP